MILKKLFKCYFSNAWPWLLQMTFIDAEAMLIALAACLVPPLPQLNRHRSVDRVSRGPTLVLLFVMAASLQLIDVACIILLTSRPWFRGGSGTAENVSYCCVATKAKATQHLLE